VRIIKRLSYGRLDGVAVCEGLALGIEPATSRASRTSSGTRTGNVRIAEVNIGEILKGGGAEAPQGVRVKATIAAKNIGYEPALRGPDPDGHGVHARFGLRAAKYVLGGATRP